MFFLRYLREIFYKADPAKPKSFGLKIMHHINRIAIILFVICLLMIIARRLTG
jgi:hypothetical protein